MDAEHARTHGDNRPSYEVDGPYINLPDWPWSVAGWLLAAATVVLFILAGVNRGEWGQDVELVVLESPYRSMLEPLLEYIEQVQVESQGYVTVILPEFVPRRIWHHLLHNQHALLI
jgi:hypothetical protein